MAYQRVSDCVGLPLTCCTKEAVELYNKGLFAYLSQCESPTPYVSEALRLDPTLILGHCFMGNIWLSELRLPNGPEVSPHLEAAKLVDTSILTERERIHLRAFLSNCSGNSPQAAEYWATILLDYPHDILAIRLMLMAYNGSGDFVKMRDCLAHILPHWKQEEAYFPHILGHYAFCQEENNCISYAEELARKALAIESKVPWAMHAMGHVLEEAWDAEESVEFLTSTRKDWADTAIGGHITWHLTLRYLDLGDINSVVREYDTVLVKRAVPNNYLGLRDATSLLWRLNLLGVDTGGRWKQVVESCSEHIQQPTTSWVDVHLMMSLAHGKVTESTARLVLAEQLIKAMKEYAESNVSVHCKITDTLGIPVCNALLAYGKEQYSEVVGLLLPLRYDIRRMGGSWAQRQVFSLTLIQAAIKSNQHSLALALVAELKAQKPKNKQLFKLFQELKQHVTVKRRDKANLSRELIPY